MKLEDIVDALAGREVSLYGEKYSSAAAEVDLLNRLIDTAEEQKQRILGALYQPGENDSGFLVKIVQGSFEYQISSPRYEDADFIKNRRRGPGGKYYPFVEIEFPCSVKIIALKQNESHETEGKVNLYNSECIVEDTVLPIPEDVMAEVTWHCKEYSFLLE